MSRDQSVTTCRLGSSTGAHGDVGHLVLIVDVDPAGLDLAGRRLLARVREAVAAWEVAEAASGSAAQTPHAVADGPHPRFERAGTRFARSTRNEDQPAQDGDVQ